MPKTKKNLPSRKRRTLATFGDAKTIAGIEFVDEHSPAKDFVISEDELSLARMFLSGRLVGIDPEFRNIRRRIERDASLDALDPAQYLADTAEPLPRRVRVEYVEDPVRDLWEDDGKPAELVEYENNVLLPMKIETWDTPMMVKKTMEHEVMHWELGSARAPPKNDRRPVVARSTENYNADGTGRIDDISIDLETLEKRMLHFKTIWSRCLLEKEKVLQQFNSLAYPLVSRKQYAKKKKIREFCFSADVRAFAFDAERENLVAAFAAKVAVINIVSRRVVASVATGDVPVFVHLLHDTLWILTEFYVRHTDMHTLETNTLMRSNSQITSGAVNEKDGLLFVGNTEGVQIFSLATRTKIGNIEMKKIEHMTYGRKRLWIATPSKIVNGLVYVRKRVAYSTLNQYAAGIRTTCLKVRRNDVAIGKLGCKIEVMESSRAKYCENTETTKRKELSFMPRSVDFFKNEVVVAGKNCFQIYGMEKGGLLLLETIPGTDITSVKTHTGTLSFFVAEKNRISLYRE